MNMPLQTVVAKIDGRLKALGFVRQKSTWNRVTGPVVEVVDVQVSKTGDTVTVNAGVLDHDVHEKLWGAAPPRFVEEPFCTVRARIGELMDGADRWWPLDNTDTPANLAQAIETHVLPFLKISHGRQAMEALLEKAQVLRKKYPPPMLSLIILKHELGRTDEACALLRDLRPKIIGAWRARFDDVAARLGCS